MSCFISWKIIEKNNVVYCSIVCNQMSVVFKNIFLIKLWVFFRFTSGKVWDSFRTVSTYEEVPAHWCEQCWFSSGVFGTHSQIWSNKEARLWHGSCEKYFAKS